MGDDPIGIPGHHIVGLEVLVRGVVEGVAVGDLGVGAADGEATESIPGLCPCEARGFRDSGFRS